MSEIVYSKKNDEIECVHYENCRKSYSPHTHASHLMVGFVESGKVCIVIDDESLIYEKGEEFQVYPNTLHEIKPVDNETYSMMVLCIKTKTDAEDEYLKELQDSILEKPENIYLIEEMAKDTGISPYHMIRKFKKAFGLTPHQFQIQCKVRKAQRLLENNKSIMEVTHESGFYDQSHLVRCFQKIVGMTPKQYQELVNSSKEQERI